MLRPTHLPADVTTVRAQQVSVKLYADGDVRPADAVRVFHRWIQTDAIDELLIDVVDYSHVHRGPGVLLITGEGEYSLGDGGDGRLGLCYARKRDEPGPLADKLRGALARLLPAAALLEQALRDALSFRGDELLVRVHNRLLAPNTAESLAGARPDLDAVTGALYGGIPASIEHASEPDELFAVRLTAPESPDLQTLQSRLSPS